MSSTNIIDGKAIAATIREEIKAEVADLHTKHSRSPGLGVILVGERRDSQTYVRMKRKAAEECGIHSVETRLSAEADQDAVIQAVEEMNADPTIDGILVQLPLPSHIDERAVLSRVSIDKDVDGFDSVHLGELAKRGGQPKFVPCTPQGCMELLNRSGVEVSGKRAVVLGRSNIVGMPMALLLINANATVTVCHSRTADLPGEVRNADIVIAALGKAEFVRGDWIKPGAVIIDVGINDVADDTKPRGYRLVGDVCYEEASKVASLITPVPGGVGPMTIAMLLKNTLTSFKRSSAQ